MGWNGPPPPALQGCWIHGSERRSGARFCGQCGNPLRDLNRPLASPAPPPWMGISYERARARLLSDPDNPGCFVGTIIAETQEEAMDRLRRYGPAFIREMQVEQISPTLWLGRIWEL